MMRHFLTYIRADNNAGGNPLILQFHKMAINNSLVMFIFSIACCFAQSGIAMSCASLQAEATLEIQYGGQNGSGVIMATSYPTSCTVSDLLSLNKNTQDSSAIIQTTSLTSISMSSSNLIPSMISDISSHTPPVFGTGGTQVINATTAGQYQFASVTGSAWTATGTTGYSTPTPYASINIGFGTHPGVCWSHLFLETGIIWIIPGIL